MHLTLESAFVSLIWVQDQREPAAIELCPFPCCHGVGSVSTQKRVHGSPKLPQPEQKAWGETIPSPVVAGVRCFEFSNSEIGEREREIRTLSYVYPVTWYGYKSVFSIVSCVCTVPSVSVYISCTAVLRNVRSYVYSGKVSNKYMSHIKGQTASPPAIAIVNIVCLAPVPHDA